MDAVADHKGFGNGRAAGRCPLGLQVHQVEVFSRQGATCAQRQGGSVGPGQRKLGSRDLAKGCCDCALDLSLIGVARNQCGGVVFTQVGERQGVAVCLGICSQVDALHLVDVDHTRGDGAQCCAGVDQCGGVDGDLAGVTVGQSASKADVQPDQSRVGLVGVVADLYIARTNVGELGKLGLYVPGQRSAVLVVADVDAGLPVVT